jgi:hypothetical protein
MEKQLTPLQQFVEWCKQSSYSVHPKAIEKAIELQVIERKGLEDAVVTNYKKGCTHGFSHISANESAVIQIAKEYFEETYKTENP